MIDLPLGPWPLALGAALPWLLVPLITLLRLRHTRRLDDYSPLASDAEPRVSMILPARNEAPNIARCVRSLLATGYANVEIIVVDDHSNDGTGEIARQVIGGDARARVTTPPPLPAGWFGKQWACAHGASLATGDVLLFTDADTEHGPELLPRAVAALVARGADLLSVSGRQEVVSVGEKLVQPVVFAGLLAWYGGTESMSRSRRPRSKIANGQFIMVRRNPYDALDGHAAVRAYVAEDLMLAQQWTAAERAVHMVEGADHLTTRMYRSFRDALHGWSKNAWAGGRHLFPRNPVVQAMARLAMPLSPLIGVVPVIAFVLGAFGVLSPFWTAFGIAAYTYQTLTMLGVYAVGRFPLGYAFAYPVAATLVAFIFAKSAWRGARTEWKGRQYRAA